MNSYIIVLSALMHTWLYTYTLNPKSQENVAYHLGHGGTSMVWSRQALAVYLKCYNVMADSYKPVL